MIAGTGASELGAPALLDMWWMLSERRHQHIDNCFLNACRWLQKDVRELCLGSWIWKLCLNKLFEEVRPNFPLWNFYCDYLYWDQQQARLGGGGGELSLHNCSYNCNYKNGAGKKRRLPHGKRFRQPLLCKPHGAEAWKMEQGSPRQRCTLTPETAKSKS